MTALLRRSLPISCLAVVTALAASAAPRGLDAQTIPGVPRSQQGQIAAYRNSVFEELKALLDAWELQVLDGSSLRLSELYAEDAVFILADGATLIGARQVAEEVHGRFSPLDRLDLRALDFDMSDRIAVVGGRMTLSGERNSGEDDACFSMVFRRDRGTWKIRSQTFCGLPEGLPSRR